MKYANTEFTHLLRTFAIGDKAPDDDPMVALRPDLFDDKPPTRGAPKPTATPAATPTAQEAEQ